MKDDATRSATPRLRTATVLATAAGETALAVALLVFVQRTNLAQLVDGRWPVPLQLAAGLALGALLAVLLVVLLASLPRWSAFSREAIGHVRLTIGDIALISVAVGVAEELLFRAALQPLAGNLLVSILFAAVHVNYVALARDRANVRLSAIAVGMVFGLSLILGVVFERVGLVAAMLAHGAYDFIVLVAYRRLARA
jgi:membrane protease YdiL (CAAX protease family)